MDQGLGRGHPQRELGGGVIHLPSIKV
jgi:hypothetical protein